jgi:hypothetical protein
MWLIRARIACTETALQKPIRAIKLIRTSNRVENQTKTPASGEAVADSTIAFERRTEAKILNGRQAIRTSNGMIELTASP